jgi:hypothetical protein
LDVDASVRPGHAIGFELDENRSTRSSDRRCVAEIDHEWRVDHPTIMTEREPLAQTSPETAPSVPPQTVGRVRST